MPEEHKEGQCKCRYALLLTCTAETYWIFLTNATIKKLKLKLKKKKRPLWLEVKTGRR